VVLFVVKSDESSGSVKPVSFQDIWLGTELDETDLTSALKYWLSKGVIRCVNGGGTPMEEESFEVIEDQAESSNDSHLAGNGDGDASSDYASYSSAQNQDAARQKQAMKATEEYVKTLLKSRGPMTLDRLFSSLQFLLQAALAENTSLTTKDFHFVNQMIALRQFLQTIPSVECLDGVYSVHQ
jgi:hypothetical protein